MADPQFHLQVGYASSSSFSITEKMPRPVLYLSLSREELDQSQEQILRLATLGKSELRKLSPTAALKDLGLKPLGAPGPVLLWEGEPNAGGYSLRSMVESNGSERLTLQGPKGLSVLLPPVIGGVCAAPAWSGDGRWVAYGSNRECQVVEIATQRSIKVVNPKANGWSMGPLIGFSPRSTRLYAAWDYEALSGYDGFKVNLETQEIVPIELSQRDQAEVWPEGLPRWGNVDFLDGESVGEEDL
jgi:roadblock/LC7 domain-containing protein